MEAIDLGAATNSQVGENVVAKSGDPYPSHAPPLAQQPSWGNILFHSPIEGHVDDTTHPYYCNIPSSYPGCIKRYMMYML